MNEIADLEKIGNTLLEKGSINPNFPLEKIQELYAIGVSHFQAGSYKKAITFLQNVVSFCPLHKDAIFLLGLCHYQLKDLELANRSFRILRFLAPNCPKGSLYIGYCLIEEGDFLEAKRFLNEAISLMNESDPLIEKTKLIINRLEKHEL